MRTSNARALVFVASALGLGLAAPELGLDRSWLGDFDGMVERRLIRALVPYSKTHYFLDGATPRGMTYELLQRFEKQVNERLRTGRLKVHVVAVPVPRDRLLPALVEGRGDLVAASLTITPAREEIVDFSTPIATGVDEIVVTGPGAPPLASLDDLAGREIYVRTSSSYYESLVALNERFAGDGREPMTLLPAEEYLEDEDLLEMVHAGLVPIVVVDAYKAELWARVLDRLTLHPDLAVRRHGEIAWAFRPGSPRLAEVVDGFIAEHRQRTLLFNIFAKRYLKSTKWIDNAAAGDDLERFRAVAPYFRKYAERYGFDWRLMIAQGYQESGLDQSVRSRVGAVGVMQLLPSTAADKAVGIPDIRETEANIHAGVKYMRYIVDRYFDDDDVDELNRTLLAMASYNAGPNRIVRLRRLTAERGLDPNVWFRNVEIVTAGEVGSEPVQYVSNIYKYYAAYRLIDEQQRLRDAAPP